MAGERDAEDNHEHHGKKEKEPEKAPEKAASKTGEEAQKLLHASATLYQDRKDMQFFDDFSDVVDLASVEMTGRGGVIDAIYPLEVSAAARQTLHLLWGKSASYPEIPKESKDQKETTKKQPDITAWSALKKSIFAELSERSGSWAKQFDADAKAALTSEILDAQQDIQPVNLLDLRAFIAHNIASSTPLPLLPAFRSAQEAVALSLMDHEVEERVVSLIALCEKVVAAVDGVIRPEWVNLIMPYVDGTAKAVSGEIAAVFAKDSAVERQDGLLLSDLDNQQMLAVTKLRTKMTLQILFDFGRGKDLAVPGTVKDLMDENIVITTVSAEECAFIAPGVRARFFTFFWVHAKSTTSQKAILRAVETSANLASGATCEPAPAQSLDLIFETETSEETEPVSEQVDPGALDIIDLNNDSTFEKIMRTNSTTPKGLKPAACWHLAHLYAHLNQFFFTRAISVWDFPGCGFNCGGADNVAKLVCADNMQAHSKLPFFGSIVISKEGGKDIKSLKHLVAETCGVSFFLVPDPVLQWGGLLASPMHRYF